MRKVISVFLTFILTVTLLLLPLFNNERVVFGDESSPSAIPECANQNPPLTVAQCADYLQGKVSQLSEQANTLSSQIAQFNSQILLSQAKISQAQATLDQLVKEIDALSTRIGYVATSVNTLEVLLKQRIIATYEQGFVSNLEIVLSSQSFSDFVLRAQYLKQVQKNDRKILANLQETKANYANQKDERQVKQTQIEASKKQLESLQASLNQQKAAKDQLLAETQGSESIYQSLLAQAKKELAGFASFADTLGGGELSGQTSCDGWGCYYNQRDNQWANTLINGQGSGCGSNNGPCTIFRVGCLVTSVAMMASHLGHRDISPADIALSGSGNFSVGTADLRKYTINVKGVAINRTPVAGSLNPNLVQNSPVIVGVYYGPFGTHFVVIKSYTNGKYIMNDPYTEGGRDKIFTDFYSLNNIFEVDTVSI